MRKVWMVRTRSGGVPKVEHDSLEKAREEARRLAREAGEEVAVLEVMECWGLPKQEPVKIKLEGEI